MRRTTVLVFAIAALLGAAGLSAETPDAGSLEGQVTGAAAPLIAASVYAYQLADLNLSKVLTDRTGAFRFDGLPAGLYKIIAFKPGFVPAVAMLSRATATARQFLELELSEDKGEGEAAGTDFWAVREQIPTDVLRDIQLARLDEMPVAPGRLGLAPSRFQAQMQASTGVHEGLDVGAAVLTGGQVGIEGQFKEVRVGLRGRFSELQSDFGFGNVGPLGRTQQVSVDVRTPDSATVRVSTLNNRLLGPGEDFESFVGFERHMVSWTQEVGRSARSDFKAQYTAENNFYRQGPIEPAVLPEASRTWRVEGSYTTPVNDRTTIQAGFRYREMQSEYAGLDPLTLLPKETVELFGRGGLQVQPAFLVEYGLYSTLRDGSLSLVPQGGLVLRLGENWRATTRASRRIDTPEASMYDDFTPAFYGEAEPCATAEEYCYLVQLSRLWDEDQKFSVGAVHRRYGETLRLFFDRDFYDRLDSLYLVKGDDLPELQFALTRRLAPKILAKLESNLASGGGGVLVSADQVPYENNVRYMVTSLDTKFEQTATGVFLAFHRLEQNLEPIDTSEPTVTYPQVALERLQVMLTQDLRVLHQFAKDWAVHLNMELSRGITPGSSALYDQDDLRKRLTGGLAVKF